MKFLLSRLVLSLFLAFGALPAHSMDASAAKYILTISTPKTVDHDALLYAFNMKMLQSLPKTTYATKTVWTDGDTQFDGVLLVDLLAVIGADPKIVTAWAVNDYMAEFVPEEFGWNAALVAYAMNGQTMQLRDKGPLWIVFP